ncbi:Gfo/Idh/MocA family oxidoreductase [Clostridium malenominatum]|uniref:Gfo/Idh/MocA family oxidoreductase n=1 Tax=Clostridium malenominatum TaxID=1539 RepID=A0ABN1IZB5_9CLOT
MDKIFNVGLIGYSAGGRIYNGPIIDSVPGFQITKIFERKDENVRLANKNFPRASIVSSINNILEDELIDLVVIAVPTPQHYSLARQSLLSNRHTIVEKPFTITSEESEDLIKLSEEKNKLLSIHHNRTWDNDFLTVKKIIKERLLGRLVQYECNFNRFRPDIKHNTWKEVNSKGSGVLYDLGSHLIHQAIFLFGLPKYINANVGIERTGGLAPDFFKLTLHYDDLTVNLNSSMLVRANLPHFVLLGDKGSYVKFGMDPQEEDLKKGLIPKNHEEWGMESEDNWGEIDTLINGIHIKGKVESAKGDYRKYYQNIYNTLIGKDKLIITPKQARDVIKVIEMAMESSDKGCTVSFK